MAEALGISRSAWAAVKHLANSGVHAGSSAAGAGRGGATDAMILIKNGTGSTLAPGHIVGLDGIVNTPATNAKDWDFYRYYKAVKPDPAKYAFAIAIEEIADGKAGYALLTGVCKVKVDVKNKEHQFARPVKDKPEQMESCAFGPARLLYKEKDSGVGEGLAQFPMGESWDWGMVLVETSQRLDAYAPLGIGGAVTAPSGTGREGTNAEFLSRVAVKGETPAKSHKDFVITLADAPGGSAALVPALYSGICPCLVNIEKKEHTHARAEGSGALKSGFSGFARIVYPTASSRSTGTQWCYVSIPESPPPVFPVSLKKTGGDAGDHQTK
ncbi:MAG: hypothetical protein FWG74_09875 [Planctomycetes bacterium]|nr:hypothetical protein [Planctomycetota bacterium]